MDLALDGGGWQYLSGLGSAPAHEFEVVPIKMKRLAAALEDARNQATYWGAPEALRVARQSVSPACPALFSGVRPLSIPFPGMSFAGRLSLRSGSIFQIANLFTRASVANPLVTFFGLLILARVGFLGWSCHGRPVQMLRKSGRRNRVKVPV